MGTYHKAEVDEHVRVLRRLLLTLHHLPLHGVGQRGMVLAGSNRAATAWFGIARHDEAARYSQPTW